MSITIQELVNNPHLKTKIIAGVEGSGNKVTWAHSCELSDPSTWLIGGELVMTNGIVIPASPQDQVDYLKILIKNEVSGLAIGKDLHAPTLTSELLGYADSHNFPILLTDYEIPWIALSKTVAVTNANQDYSRIMKVMKLYNLIYQSVYQEPTHKLFDLISDILGTNIKVVDALNKKVLFNTVKKDSVDEENKNTKPAPIKAQIPSTRPMYLLIDSLEQEELDTLVINHLSTIVGLFIERDTAYYERKRRNGSEILFGLIENQYSFEVTSMFMSDHDLDKEELYLTACIIEERNFNSSWLHIGLYEQNIPNLLTFKDKILFVLLPAKDNYLEILMEQLPDAIHLGVSKGNNRINFKKMYKEAVWALRSAETLNKKISYYDESLNISPFLPNSQTEAEELVHDVLGHLLDYDSKHKSHLIKTLYVFLLENQSWKTSSEILFIHKQTLVYRINRIEEILDTKLNNINNVTEIWIALQTAIILNLVTEFAY